MKCFTKCHADESNYPKLGISIKSGNLLSPFNECFVKCVGRNNVASNDNFLNIS